eukprot:3677378-Prymnesium_polylepis.1
MKLRQAAHSTRTAQSQPRKPPVPMARACAPVLARPEARRVPVRAQVTLALAPALELKLAH